MRVVVIGAGVIGCCAALRLAEAGARVSLLSETGPGATLSAHSFGWANAIDDGSSAYYDLSVEALAAQERLAVDTAESPRWLWRRGNLHWADDAPGAAALRDTAAGYREHGYPVAELSPAEVRRELEPGLRLDGVAGPVYFYPDDMHVMGDLMLSAVLRRARTAGVRLRIGEPVATVFPDGSGVRFRDGESLAADAVLCCAGRGNIELLAGLGVALPLLEPGSPQRLTRGLLVRTTRVAEPVTRVVHAPGLSIRPDRDDRLMLHCHDLDHTLTADSDALALADRILDRLPVVLPGAAGAGVESLFVGVRPMPRDGRSIVGPVRDAEGVYVVATHSGMTLAPVLAEIAAREVLGAPDPSADAFRPERFALL
ncbi:FAD-binding oxidoreductase [Nocardia terpenica]|uniref:NAD(P)/FAD-dependent oxidoreductase n=1 Tax=Nocardia terpenica TaxID=455432 RepID=UPI00189386C2|nr:FAD-binding oxidoreductase [Nocardia terpenica]MBF6063775.1 FAD-binding oxidoreductase [Nocardia terpenica]MBF6107151.1 FAD-binding oxidoreductase [Nocardia terpenica]MBF6114324.1 FAD-binding oxidoreductase [Nocardia terpenica]MBF6121589.1 FAD-binding oxidoreductase [Nocardia terpenica]MBF6154004.1 FAD-binding oxidoreductase [Nocardia terpenica]